MTLFARLVRSTLVSSIFALGACSSPSPMQPDTGPADTGVVPDAGPLVPHWSAGPDYPTPIAFGAAMIIPGTDGTSAYLYVIGGGSGSFGGPGPFHAEIRRSLIAADGSLGAWEDAGNIGNGNANIPLAGHGAFRIVGETGEVGMAIAGGGSSAGLNIRALGGYQQAVDGSIGEWGAFPPILDLSQAVLWSSFNTFEAHQWALIGGMQGTAPVDQVVIAAVMAGTSVPTWRVGPSLPAPRYGHGTVQLGTATPDVFVIGGATTGGTVASDILVSVRDTTTMDVTAWATAGQLTSAVVFPQTSLIGDHVYVIGGVEGDPGIDPLATSVRMATATPSSGTSHATIGTLMRVAGADLPEGRAAGLTATYGNFVYIVGGMMGQDHAASSSVIYAQLER